MQMRHAFSALLTILMCAAGGGTSGTASITGTIMGLSSDQPIAEATVSISAPALPGGRKSATTDNQGRFVFSDLPADRYYIFVSKQGFVNVNYGQRRVGGAGLSLAVLDGQRQNVALRLPRLSVITGLAVDERGNPAVNASVRAVRFTMAFGYRRADTAGSATTDDRGIYRIHSLQPGDYAVCASTHSTAPLNEAQRLRMDIDNQRNRAAYVLGPPGVQVQRDLAPRLAALEARLPPQVDPVRGYATVCHPGSAALPSMIRLAPEEERASIDFQFALTRLARVEGFVTGGDADTTIDPISLVNADDPMASNESVRSDFEGRFTFTNVPPGRYRILLRATAGKADPPSRLRADADITVADDDLDNVVLQLQNLATLAGRVMFEGTPPSAAGAPVQIHLSPAVPGPLSLFAGVNPATPDESGRFLFANIPSGEYRIAGTNSADWFVEAATIAGRDVLDQPLTIKPGENATGVLVTLTNRRAKLAGAVVDDQGEPMPAFILVYPTDERLWTGLSRRMFATRAKPDGSFVVTGLIGGSYHVATMLDVEPGAWLEPAFLRGLRGGSIPLVIGDGEKKVLNLRVPK